ncbi:hypothetical protein ACLBOM_00750 [Escherichia coli]
MSGETEAQPKTAGKITVCKGGARWKKMIFVAALLTITQHTQASAVIVASAAATTAAVAAETCDIASRTGAGRC